MIIFFYGEDSFRSGQKVREIKQKFLEKDAAASGLSVFDFEDKAGSRQIINVLNTPNLLAPKRLVIVKNLISNGAEADQEEMLDYLKKNKSLADDSDLVVVFWESGKLKKSQSLLKLLEKIARRQQFEKLSGAKLGQWALKRIKEINDKTSISKPALEKLLAYAGDDDYLLEKEIQKLANYAAGRMTKDEDVEILVRANVDSNIFATVDALGNNNKKSALELLHRHLSQGEDPFYILSMFVYQFRNLIKVADLKDNHRAGEFEIAKISKLHPFVVKKSLAQIRNFPADKLKKVYQKLMELDTNVKTGRIEIKLALDKFIVEL